MDVYIVRDAAEIGHFPRAELGQLARAGQLLPTDYYWHEGMENWGLLPELLGPDAWEPAPITQALAPDPSSAQAPAPAPTPASTSTPAPVLGVSSAFLKKWAAKVPRPDVALAIGGVLIILVLAAIHSARSKRADTTPSRPASQAPDVVAAMAVRENAATDLKHKIDGLPSKATPPLYAFYYDVSVFMSRSSDRHVPWTATIHGEENTIDPSSEATIRRTEFSLTVDYRNGEWTYKHYWARETDAANGAAREMEHDENTPLPPNIVGMLGLQR